MKITIKQLKRIIKEDITASYEELDRRISSMDPDTIVDEDYIDDETGEIHLQKGMMAKQSMLHPDHRAWTRSQDDERRQIEDEEFRAEYGDDDLDYINDELDSLDSMSDQAEFDQAVEEFASSFREDNQGDEAYDEGSFYDAAENFFYNHPEWEKWSKSLGLTRQEIKTYVADMMS